MAYENTTRVITIPATEQPESIVLRVAAYCRVSSSSDEQLNSFAVQNRYYTELISGNENWKLVDIYADEGITGTSIEKREDFKRMIHDCERGLIDRILVKSISRFARNTTECLETVRILKAHGISVFFEKENIDTGKVSGEMLTAVFASLAQAESESISKNMRWSYQKRMEAGVYLPPSTPFGYSITNGKYEIVYEEAEIVKYIFEQYVSGQGMDDIATSLNSLDVASHRQWHSTTILYILSNENYTGNSLWQKTYATSTLPTMQIKNKGELPQYRVLNTHPAIISRALFNLATDLRLSRCKSPKEHNCDTDAFRGKLLCNECGTPLLPKIANNRLYWVCRLHNRNKTACSIPPIADSAIKESFKRLQHKLKHHPEILSQMLYGLAELRNHRMLWSADVIELNKQISDALSQNQMLTTLKQQGLVDPDIFISKSNELSKQLRELKLQKDALLNSESDDCIARTRQLIDVINDAPEFIDEFDDEMLGELVDKVIVESNISLVFRLKNGLELREAVERSKR